MILTLYVGVAVTSMVLQTVAEFYLKKDNLTSQIQGLSRTFEPYSELYQMEISLNRGETEPLGQLRVFDSSSTVIERVWSTLLVTMVAAFLKTLGLWLIAVAVINRLVAQPIGKMTSEVRDFDIESRRANRTQEKVRNNELGLLEESFQLFFETISSRNQTLYERDQEVAAHKLHLEERVEERTESLNQAMEQLREAGRVKSEFLAAMSHEIRTPMNAVLGGLQLLQKSELDAKQTKLLETINHGGRDLMVIINDILNYSKIEAERLNLEVIPFDFVQLVNRVVEMFRPTAEAKHLEINFDTTGLLGDTNSLVLLGDPTRVAQVFNNMLSNAIKCTDQGSVSIAIAEPVQLAERLVRVEVTVTDTGIGIDEEQIKGLFDLFSQADNSTTRKYGGTGLGLAICEKLLEAMCGEVNVTSEPGAGTCFTIVLSLPLSQELLPSAPEYISVRAHQSVNILKVLAR